MPWPHLLVAFLAGYGLMSLLLYLAGWVRRRISRPLTASALLLANDDEERIEGVLRGLQAIWDQGGVAEVLVRVEGGGGTRAIAARLAGVLPGVRLLPEGLELAQALAAVKSCTAWVVDLARLPRDFQAARLTVPAPGRRFRGGRSAGRPPSYAEPLP
ncbi:MAG: hypothetical protein ACM3X6_05955 [Patescibacteria group bacterium]